MSVEGVSTQLCGNWVVEGDEGCDSGPGGDGCCDSTCELRRNATCRWVCLGSGHVSGEWACHWRVGVLEESGVSVGSGGVSRAVGVLVGQ